MNASNTTLGNASSFAGSHIVLPIKTTKMPIMDWQRLFLIVAVFSPLAVMLGCSPGTSSSPTSMSTEAGSSLSSSSSSASSSYSRSHSKESASASNDDRSYRPVETIRKSPNPSRPAKSAKDNPAVTRMLNKIKSATRSGSLDSDVLAEFLLSEELAKHGKPALGQIIAFQRHWVGEQRRIRRYLDSRYFSQDFQYSDFAEYCQARSCVSIANQAMKIINASN